MQDPSYKNKETNITNNTWNKIQSWSAIVGLLTIERDVIISLRQNFLYFSATVFYVNKRSDAILKFKNNTWNKIQSWSAIVGLLTIERDVIISLRQNFLYFSATVFYVNKRSDAILKFKNNTWNKIQSWSAIVGLLTIERDVIISLRQNFLYFSATVF